MILLILLNFLSVDYANTIKHQAVTKIIHGIYFVNYSFSVNNQVVVFGCFTKVRKTKGYDDCASLHDVFTDYGLLIFKKFHGLTGSLLILSSQGWQKKSSVNSSLQET